MHSMPSVAAAAGEQRQDLWARKQMAKTLDAFLAGSTKQAEAVLKGDDLLDVLYLKIFNELLAFMMEDSRNIRRATSLLFVAKHLERVGDHAQNIAEMIIYMV